MKNAFFLLLAVMFVGSGCMQAQNAKPGAAETENAINKKDPSICLKLQEKTFWYTSKDGNPTYASPKKDCLIAYYEHTNALGDCDIIKQSLGIEEYKSCINYMARVHSDPSICDSRGDAAQYPLDKINCVATASLDPRDCLKINDYRSLGIESGKLASDLGNCLMVVGREKRDYQVCAMIDGPDFGNSIYGNWQELRNWCLGWIAACTDSQRKPEISTKALCDLMVEGTRPGSAKNLELENCRKGVFGECVIFPRVIWPAE